MELSILELSFDNKWKNINMMDPDYLPFHANPRKPSFTPPKGAVDAHCHVFGPADKFPYAKERKYTPCDAPSEKLFQLRDYLGFERNVIVQASCHGKNNDALIDALENSNNLARGVAIISPDICDADLRKMDQAGVRAVRFNFVKRLVDDTPKEIFFAIAERVKKLGWHIVVYFEADDLVELIPFLESLPTIVVVDHMGRPDISNGIDDTGFQQFIQLLERNKNIWTKVSCPERLSIAGPPYEDVVSFARTLVEKFPDRVLWGTDWPHPNMKSHIPDEGVLVDVIEKIATSKIAQQKLLVDNPMRLYWER